MNKGVGRRMEGRVLTSSSSWRMRSGGSSGKAEEVLNPSMQSICSASCDVQ